MENNSTFHFITKFAVLIGIALLCTQSLAQEDSRSDIPTFKMTGDVAMLTNYVEHGLTQSNKDPSLQAGFGFNFGPQFKLGLWGSNVNYESSEHFLLKLNAELKVLVSSKTDFKVGYHNNRYFKSDIRNGNTTYLVITSHGYRVRYESNTNWNGTDSSSTYYSFGKSFDLTQSWKWDNEVGYTMIKDVEDMDNFFDVRTSFLYKADYNNIVYQITATATSDPGQFSNGQGDFFFILGASTSF